ELPVIAALLQRQQLLPVGEHAPVLPVGERPSGLDELERGACLARQPLGRNFARVREAQPAASQQDRRADHAFGFSRSRSPSSRSCFSSTGLGACTSRSWARCVFGNAITSRIDAVPAMRATRRSRPNAMPPCGGAPN